MNMEITMSEYITIEIYARTNRVGSKDTADIEIDREEWEAMSDSEKEERMFQKMVDNNLFEWGWNEKE